MILRNTSKIFYSCDNSFIVSFCLLPQCLMTKKFCLGKVNANKVNMNTSNYGTRKNTGLVRLPFIITLFHCCFTYFYLSCWFFSTLKNDHLILLLFIFWWRFFLITSNWQFVFKTKKCSPVSLITWRLSFLLSEILLFMMKDRTTPSKNFLKDPYYMPREQFTTIQISGYTEVKGEDKLCSPAERSQTRNNCW